MKTIHLLCVEGDVESFAPLLAAARAAGTVAGWLELDAAEPPPSLGRAAEAGALRAVAAGPRGSVTVKARRGPAVLGDLLREHFRGCRVVLVRGALAVPRLRPAGAGWRIERDDAPVLELDTEALIARLRKPRPWS